MKYFSLEKWIFAIIVFLLPIGVFFSARDPLARALWEKFGDAEKARVLVWRDTDLLMQLGNYYFGGGIIGRSEHAPEKAKRLYKKVVARNLQTPWGHYQLARIYFIEGDFENALKEIHQELEIYPTNFRSLYVRGLIYGYRGREDDLVNAEEDFKKFIEWSPSEWAGYNDLVWILGKREKYEEMERIVISAFENIPIAKENNPWLWNSLGVAELNLQKYEEAHRSFRRAHELLEKLPLETWRNAYPGNSPDDVKAGRAQFQKAIEENIIKAKEFINS